MRARLAALVAMLGLSLAGCLSVGPALAEALSRAPRPVLRQDAVAASAATSTAPSLRPRPRPLQLAPPAVAPTIRVAPAKAVEPPPRRLNRPDAAEKKRRRAARQTDATAPRAGSVCGDPRIIGAELARISSPVTGCGIADPVRVASVSGVRLSPAATLDCDTAKALRKWVDRALQPSFGKSKVVQLQVAAHYVCRGRNNKKSARVSEHGRGRAIDISGFVLANGAEVSVAQNWRSRHGRSMKRAYKAACGTFGTTLGPGSDGFHEDHIHLDTARHRSGAYCR